MKNNEATQTRGRPRSFDAEEALDKALQVFWRQGYEGTSLSDLTEAMGINRPSLYAAFGNKEELFRQVLDRYAEGPAAYVRKALEEPTARKMAEALLRGGLAMGTCAGNPGGCLAVQSALACGTEAESVKESTAARRRQTQKLIYDRLVRAQTEGDLPPGAEPCVLALYLCVLMHGISVQSASHECPDALTHVVDLALAHWPSA